MKFSYNIINVIKMKLSGNRYKRWNFHLKILFYSQTFVIYLIRVFWNEKYLTLEIIKF